MRDKILSFFRKTLGFVHYGGGVENELVELRRRIAALEASENERKEKQVQLEHSEKLTALGKLARGVGHELRNPLGAIKNATYFIKMALEEPKPEVKEAIEILEKNVKRSEEIISGLLVFAYVKPPTLCRVNINDVLQEALFRAAMPDLPAAPNAAQAGNVEVVTQMDETLPTVLADPDQLSQAFGNIILNAIQAMSEGGQLTVKTKTESPEWVAVSFTDTGPGIPGEKLQKVFEPLFTTKAKGIGLGLALTKTLIEAHGGSIEVESPSTSLRAGEAGRGSTFIINLPISSK